MVSLSSSEFPLFWNSRFRPIKSKASYKQLVFSTVFVFCALSSFSFVVGDEECSKISKDPGLVRFFLYSQQDKRVDDALFGSGGDEADNSELEAGEELIYGDLNTFHNSSLNFDTGFIILIHGFNSHYTSWFPQKIKDAYLENNYEDNIITVDWGPLAKPRGSLLTNYHCAVHNVPRVANEVVAFLSALLDNNLIKDVNSVHIVGFSLGAHVSGWVGKNMQDKYQLNIGRITGLDPAGPLFTLDPNERHLHDADAVYVDVIHTNKGEYGILDSVGNADYFVNGGGPKQPGCSITNASCSHATAPNYFRQSIGNPNILACECKRYIYCWIGRCKGPYDVPFGENSKPGTYGRFYLEMKPVAA